MMKLLYSILVSGILLNISYTQTNPLVVIANDEMNDVYIGLDNPITIVASGIPCNALRVEITEGSIKGDNCTYVLRIRRWVEKTTITVFSGNTKIDSVDFVVRQLPNPTARIAGKSSGEISIEELLSNPYLLAKIPDFDFDTKFMVVSFALRYEDEYEHYIEGYDKNLTGEMKEAIKQFKNGQKIVFEDIKAVAPDGRIRKLTSMSFTIN